MRNLDIRLMTKNDFPRVVPLLEDFVTFSSYDLPFDVSHVESTFNSLADSEDALLLVLVDTDDDDVCGIFGAVVNVHLYSPVKVASELVWWVKPEVRGRKESLKMLRAFEYWARNVKAADFVSMSSLSVNQSVSKIYQRYGYKEAETAWIKGLR